MKLLITIIFLCFASMAEEKISSYKLIENLDYYPDQQKNPDSYLKQRCKLDLFYPKGVKDFQTIIWFHGGGLELGKKRLPMELKYRNMAVVSVNYRLSPKVKSPVCTQDAAAAVAWVVKNIAQYGGDPQKVFVTGHSAGGYLASMVALDKSLLAAHNLEPTDLAGFIPLSGHTITHFTVRKEMGIDRKQVHVGPMAPLYHIYQGTPPILLITGDRELEMLGRYEENAYFYRMLKVHGNENVELIELKGKDHSTMVAPSFPYIINFMEKYSKKN